MGFFKITFRGYKREDVDNAIVEKDKEIEKLQRQNSALEKEISDLRTKLQISKTLEEKQNEEIISRKEEISNQKESYRMLQRNMEKILVERAEEAKKNSSDAHKLGGLYIKAYEFSRSIADSPKEEIERYLSLIEKNAQISNMEYRAVVCDFEQSKKNISSLIGEIQSESENILSSLEKLKSKFDDAGDIYRNVGDVRSAYENTVEKLTQEYDMAVNELLKTEKVRAGYMGVSVVEDNISQVEAKTSELKISDDLDKQSEISEEVSEEYVHNDVTLGSEDLSSKEISVEADIVDVSFEAELQEETNESTFSEGLVTEAEENDAKDDAEEDEIKENLHSNIPSFEEGIADLPPEISDEDLIENDKELFSDVVLENDLKADEDVFDELSFETSEENSISEKDVLQMNEEHAVLEDEPSVNAENGTQTSNDIEEPDDGIEDFLDDPSQGEESSEGVFKSKSEDLSMRRRNIEMLLSKYQKYASSEK